MEIFFYIIIFLIGIIFGSFYTLAVHRIPRKENITYKHSYCPNCEHKLGFIDLIPVFSYMFLGAKCRYCKQKIRPRYFILEILSGCIFVLIAYLMNLSIYNLSFQNVLTYFFVILYLTFLILVAGIDKENKNIEKSLTIYGIVISIIYIVYLCVVEKFNIYRYAIYMVYYILFLILDTITLRKYAKSKYINQIILMIITMAIFTGEYITINSLILSLIAISIYILIHKIKNLKTKKSDKQIFKNISVAYFISVSNIINFLIVLAYYKLLN